MRDPSTLAGAAFGNPPGRSGDVNTREWRAAEIPAANGHGTARAVARIYAALARGGELEGVRILAPESIERATTEQAVGPDAVLGRIEMRFGLGFMLRHRGMPMSEGPAGFGHAGAGGSLGCADPDTQVGFGYTMNRMQAGLGGGPGAYALLKAMQESLAS
jgi:CubicO group peptidase (beta-lactamase class C family)